MAKTVIMEMFVDFDDISKVLKKIDEIQSLEEVSKPTRVGNCGWANAPKCWFVRCNVTEEHRRELIDYMIDEEVKKYDPTYIY